MSLERSKINMPFYLRSMLGHLPQHCQPVLHKEIGPYTLFSITESHDLVPSSIANMTVAGIMFITIDFCPHTFGSVLDSILKDIRVSSAVHNRLAMQFFILVFVKSSNMPLIKNKVLLEVCLQLQAQRSSSTRDKLFLQIICTHQPMVDFEWCHTLLCDLVSFCALYTFLCLTCYQHYMFSF